jgi:hypothetical protein
VTMLQPSRAERRRRGARYARASAPAGRSLPRRRSRGCPPAQIRQLVYNVRRFYGARSEREVAAAASIFAHDAQLDIPLADIHGRDRIRCA